MKVPYFRMAFGGSEFDRLREVLESGWLTTASRAAEFEREFARRTEADHALAVNSCTAAIHLALEAVGVAAGDQVIVPSLTFTATAEVVRYLQAEPVLCDVDYATGCMTPPLLAAALERAERARAVVVVHFGGQPAPLLAWGDQPGLLPLCRSRNLRLIEDAAHAFPARHAGRPIGALTDAACFSFYANKTITTGEGGMLTTNDPEVAARAKIMRLHGMDRSAWDRYTSQSVKWEYDVVAPGFKYNMPDLCAALGLAQLEGAERFRAARQHRAQRYLDALRDLPLDLPGTWGDLDDHAWHLFPIVLHPDAPMSRGPLIDALHAREIGSSVHYKPLHRLRYYRERADLDPAHYPNAERRWQGTVSLPLYPDLTDAEQDHVIDTLRELLGGPA